MTEKQTEELKQVIANSVIYCKFDTDYMGYKSILEVLSNSEDVRVAIILYYLAKCFDGKKIILSDNEIEKKSQGLHIYLNFLKNDLKVINNNMEVINDNFLKMLNGIKEKDKENTYEQSKQTK